MKNFVSPEFPVIPDHGLSEVGQDRLAKENPPRRVAASFPGRDLLHAFGSVRSRRSRFGRVRLPSRALVGLSGLRLRSLGPLVQDAVEHGFGGVIFSVSDLARFVTAEGFGGEGQRFGDLFGPDLRVVGMEGGFEPEETPPGEEEILLPKACQGGGIEGADRFETPSSFGFIGWDEVGMQVLVVVV